MKGQTIWSKQKEKKINPEDRIDHEGYWKAVLKRMKRERLANKLLPKEEKTE